MLEGLIIKYGLFAVLIGSGIEGETVVFLSGVIAHRHILPYWGVACAAAAGSFIADQILFFLGRRASGWTRLQRLTSNATAAKVKAMLESHPTGFIFAFRFIYGIRTISPIIIGLSGIPARKFLIVNGLAALLWGIVISAAGYLFSSAVEALLGRMHLHNHLIIGSVFAITIAIILTIRTRRKLGQSKPERS